MVNTLFCSQCGRGGNPPIGILFERKPGYIDRYGTPVNPDWEKVGTLCSEHLRINGDAAKTRGMEIKIEFLSDQRIESKG